MSVEHPYLAASPDGITNNRTLVEVKCPYTGRHDSIQPSDRFPFLTEDMKLSKIHNYYAQVQGQMFICDMASCDLVVYTLNDFKIIKVELDKQYINNTLIPAITAFYYNTLLPHIVQRM